MYITLLVLVCNVTTLQCIQVYTKEYPAIESSKCHTDKVKFFWKYKNKFPDHMVGARCKYSLGKK